MIKNIKSKVLITVVCILGLSNTAAGAQQILYFSGPVGAVAVGSPVVIKILLDSDQPLNAYSASFSYSSKNLELVNFDNSRSLIDISQGQPIIFEGGGVKFKGGSLKPFRGGGGELLTVNFKAIGVGPVELAFGQSALYLANGKGTKVIPTVSDLKFNVVETAAGSPEARSPRATLTRDVTPPEIKFLGIISDPFNSNQKLLGFSVADADSGIKETLARSRSILFWSDWKQVRNPTALSPYVWAVNFKAIDNNGNVAERIVYDDGVFWRLVLIALPFALGIIFILILIVKKGRKVQ